MSAGRLLILDDDPTVGQILAFVAETVDFATRLAVRPAQFFDALSDWQPTHVAIDLTMPEMSGTQVLQRLAALGCRARVIVASGAGTGELDGAARLAKSLGLDLAGPLSKPFSPSTLRALLAAPLEG
ncbi:MAG: response regulator [Pseudomonadota bacterium]|nr:response regulator [Pseudomonadota bacterium]